MRCTLRLENLTKDFVSQRKTTRAVDSVSLDFPAGAFITLLGPSGCGKTTVLRMIAGLEMPTGGDVLIDGKSVANVPPNQRETAMVFQSYALFPHMTVFENVAYGLRLRKVSEPMLKAAVAEKLEMMGLWEMAGRQPNQLSGGQQQRVAIARAIASHPSILLGDEPTGALDSRTGQEVLALFQELNEEGRTVVLVTHDERVAAHCKRVVRLSDGLIVSDIINQERLDARAELARMAPHGGEVARPS